MTLVALAAGNAYDVNARVWATYMGKYIPGKPNIMIQHIRGASSMIAANYLSNVAKPDDLAIHNTVPSRNLEGRADSNEELVDRLQQLLNK